MKLKENYMADTSETLPSRLRPLSERLGVWIATLGSLLTIALTIWNARTKNDIDQLEVQLRTRTAAMEESKEKVERYKWVLSLLPSLTEKDEVKREFTRALVRLSLTKEEAGQLFSGLQLSSNHELREVGLKGFESVENEDLNRLVLQMNANSADERKSAVARLEKDYGSSSAAISLVLDQLSPGRISTLSPSGVINSIYYLSSTDPQAWTAEERKAAAGAISRISGGPQTKAAVDKLKTLLSKLDS
jgi:hypothetical protein